MVQNSLGRLFVDKRKNEGVFADGRGLDEMTWDEAEDKRITAEKNLAEQMEWKYYLPEAAQTKEVRKQLNKIQQQSEYKDVQDIKVIDPCMGSGHILVYAFDVLMQMYEDAGYSQRDAAKSILENNLYGLDIDDRAYQLAYFAVMMKARQYNRRILNGENTCHVYSIQESNNINRAHLKYLGAGIEDLEANTARVQLDGLLDTLRDAKEYGSILKVENYNWELLRRFVSTADAGEQISMDSAGLEVTIGQLLTLIDIAQTMTRKYDVVVTNPPYMGAGGMSAKLADYVKTAFPDSKGDMSTVCMEKTIQMCKTYGFMAMINIPVWMFLSSYEKLRKKIFNNQTIVNMVHPGRGIFGSDFGTTTFVIRNTHEPDYQATYRRLFEIQGEVKSNEERESAFLSGKGKSTAVQDNFEKIPGAPLAYWVGNNFFSMFSQPALKDIAFAGIGMRTGDNERFLRFWHEISRAKMFTSCVSAQDALEKRAKWIPYNKGGNFRRWYGNNEYVVNWENNGQEIKDNTRKVYPQLGDNLGWKISNEQYYFHEGITWTVVSSKYTSFRRYYNGAIISNSGQSVVSDNKEILDYLTGLLNSNIVISVLGILSPTIGFESGYINKIPVIIDRFQLPGIVKKTQECIQASKYDWDSFETSWDFMRHPLAPLVRDRQEQEASQFHSSHMEKFGRIAWHYEKWEHECEDRFAQLKANEEDLNRIFIDIYGLKDELSPEVEDKDVTVRKADLQRDIKSLLSYAVGCMFGRYSLDSEGLAYAGGNWDESKYNTFLPDVDGILPITDEEYLGDDIVTRLCSWLKVVYGVDTLEENLDFVAKALGGRGNSSREIIRNYFLKDFFKDHCKIYQKRPIYWLFDSGKQNGFKALIYLHRYTPDTIGNLRVDYLHKMQRVYESEIGRMQDMIDHSTNAREVAAATKRKEKLQKQLKECRDYDEMIAHLALSRIELDLDDGVKVNYRKMQTAADGKFYEVLADSKSIMVKEK